MKKLIFAIFATVLLTSCGAPTTLYYWGGESKGVTTYEELTYQTFKKQTPKSLCNLIEIYEKMVAKPGGMKRVPPPGICAEYGYLLLLPETASAFNDNASSSQKRLFKTRDYATYFREKGEELLKKEIELYPESAKFIEPLIIKLTR